jgi:hypothetical protein
MYSTMHRHPRATRIEVRTMLHTTLLRSGDDPGQSYQSSDRNSVSDRLAIDPMLALYVEGWAEADPTKIAGAATDDYDFHDPLVGHFSRRTLPRYFDLLCSRFALGGVSAQEVAFTLRGPMATTARTGRQYWREAPFLGLTGFAEVTVRHGRVVTEAVAYDLNIACETLRGYGPGQAGADARGYRSPPSTLSGVAAYRNS